MEKEERPGGATGWGSGHRRAAWLKAGLQSCAGFQASPGSRSDWTSAALPESGADRTCCASPGALGCSVLPVVGREAGFRKQPLGAKLTSPLNLQVFRARVSQSGLAFHGGLPSSSPSVSSYFT